MQRIEIAGRTYEMDNETAGLLRMMMDAAVTERSKAKAQAAMEFAAVAEGFGRAKRVG